MVLGLAEVPTVFPKTTLAINDDANFEQYTEFFLLNRQPLENEKCTDNSHTFNAENSHTILMSCAHE